MPDSIPERGVFRTRRDVLMTAGALAAGATAALAGVAAAPESPQSGPQRPAAGRSGAPDAAVMQIGVLLGTFPGPTLEARLDAVKSCGLACVQLSLDCAGVAAMPDEIAPELA
ncbi:MAG TPA: hypothetical protein DCM87_14730, partial [Planctomycetes bacterium]|nr:hypothetical protein [Planctomycetota bacterium]